MSRLENKKLILTNLVLWIIAMLLHPLAGLLPTSTGSPPRILSLMIPLFFLMLAYLSTSVLKEAIRRQPPKQ